jgi:drug/metabolite transporter (DMT)-like permease
MKPQTLGLVLLFLGAAADSTSGVLSRLTTADGFTTVAARGGIAFVVLFAALVWRDGRGFATSIRALGGWGALFVLLNATGMLLNVLALKHGEVANFFMIFATAPFVAAILARFLLAEPLDLPTLIAASAGFAGIAIMVAGGVSGQGMLGNVLAAAVVVIYAFVVLIVRRAPKIDTLPLICMTVFASGLLGLPLADFSGLIARDWLALTVFGVVQLAIGNYVIFLAAARISAAQSGMLGIINAVFAPAWVLLVLGEVPPTATLIGGAVILTAASLHLIWVLRPKARGQDQNQD